MKTYEKTWLIIVTIIIAMLLYMQMNTSKSIINLAKSSILHSEAITNLSKSIINLAGL